ncbi:hypothetical protein GJ496_002921 [Pomphorhynchus laevis]|nr:hypothetical protein GJ496_002921 [Pomphorhynchus laevis]
MNRNRAYDINDDVHGNLNIDNTNPNAFIQRTYRHRSLQPCRIPSLWFKKMFLNGQFPFRVQHFNSGNRLQWTVLKDQSEASLSEHINALDINVILPNLFDGLCECERPFNIVATLAIKDVLSVATHKIDVALMRQISLLIRRALLTRNPSVAINCIEVLETLIAGDNDNGHGVGQCIIPFMGLIIAPIAFFENYRGHNPCKFLSSSLIYEENRMTADHLIQYSVKHFFAMLEDICGYEGYRMIKSHVPKYDSQRGFGLKT